MIEVLTTVAHTGTVKIFRFWSQEFEEYVDLIIDFNTFSVTAAASTDDAIYNRSLSASAKLIEEFIADNTKEL
jgi:16S rRNA G527 N7-methylase RsmG